MKTLNDQNFKEETKNGIVLVDMYADWCGPCKALSPILEELEGQVEGVTFAKVDVDACPNTSEEFGIMSIPTVIIMKDGKEFKTLVGLMPKASYINALEEAKK